MQKFAVTSAALVALVIPAAALAEGEPRLAQYVDQFSSELPGTTAARHTETDLVNPADPDGKPPAISHVLVELAPGTVIDTAAVPRCEANDAELMARGVDACPPESVVGRGVIDVDTGFEGDARHVVSDVVFVNAEDQLVFVTTQHGTGTHLIIRGQLSNGNELTIDVPPIPGTPPDGGAETHEVLDLDARSSVRDGRRVSYITTPPECPASETWTNRVTYTFRDGEVQSFTTTTPCRRPAARPRLRLSGVPRGCVRRSFPARVAVRSAPGLETVDIYVDGRRVRRVPQFRFTTDVGMRGLRAGSHRLSVVARMSGGRTLKRSARFRRCRAGGSVY